MSNTRHFFKAVFILLALSVHFAHAQNVSQKTIRLKEVTLSPQPNAGDWLNTYISQQSPTPVLVLIHFNSPIVDKQMLAERGILLEDYIDKNTYTAIVYPTVSMSILNNVSIYSITNFKPEWKTSKSFWSQNVSGNGKLDIIVSFSASVPDKGIKTFLQSVGASVISKDLAAYNIYKITLPAGKLFDFAQWYGVKYFHKLTDDVPLNVESKAAGRANLLTSPVANGGAGLTGAGVSVGVGDNTSGAFHIDLRDRIINYNPQPYTNHGVHINGIVGGAGIVDPRGEGHAPGATLVDHFFSSVVDQTGAMFQTHNMTITNNSYAAVVGDCTNAGNYDVNAQAVDAIALQYDEVLHVFAAGNDGYLDCSPYPAGFATVNGGYQPAKNNVVVTSTDKRYVNARDGGRGPVKDGRLKPEMTAVGVDVNSTTRNESYLVAGGTSMACPAVAGGLALLTERYRQLKGNVNPKAILLKTLILNGTMDIGIPGPDYRYGFGFMDLYRSLQMLNNEQYMLNTVAQGAQQSINVNVPAGTAQLKVMVSWHDAPSSPAAANHLVNDLDLEVLEPGFTLHRPLILDPTPANINNPAVEGVDRRNNTEQVIVYNPQPGIYTITVKGFSLPAGNQAYALAYDVVPEGILLSHPTTGTQVKTEDSLRIYWFSPDADVAPFTLEYSTDDGQNWNLIDNNIAAEQRQYAWYVPQGINSGNCRMRIQRNNSSLTNTTGKFVINTQPEVTLDATQCPGYIRINWTAVPNASGYRVYRKIGPSLEEVGTSINSSYTFSGLSPDSMYYVAVSPVIDGLTGYRSLAIKRQPNDGDCSGSISDNDLMLSAGAKPLSGRKFTSTELTANETLSIVIRNLDDVTNNNYNVSYSINGNAWQSQVFNTPIPGVSTNTVNIAGLDLSAIGVYDIRVAVQNLLAADPVGANDTLRVLIKHVSNDPINLAGTHKEDFENMETVNIINDLIGFSSNPHWDYANADSGRLRSFVNPLITLEGTRSISMDAVKPVKDNLNELTGTFNLDNYNAATDEIRLEFDYMLHNIPRFPDGNEVWVRGSDSAPWEKIYEYPGALASIGQRKNSGTLSITDALQKTSQDFSSSFQVKFGQRDSTLIAARNYGTGITLDNVLFYTVQNDLQLLSVLSPLNAECGLTGVRPIVVNIRNGVNQALNNVRLHYRLDNGATVMETIATIQGKQSLTYTFQQKADLSAPGAHVLDVWVDADGDTYRKNDSSLNYVIHNQPLITSYPYLEDFEDNDGFWYAEGINSSWQHGVPAGQKINKAASGTKVWKTGIDGLYNNNEVSYLLSPCFDISGLQNPMLRFKLATDIENCGAQLCDMAFMEYSFDGVAWQKLGAPKQGINWYNDSAYVWNEQDAADWREALTPLSKGNVLRLRYVFVSDQALRLEGIAVDDITIFDQKLYSGTDMISISPNPTSNGTINIEWVANGTPVLEIAMTDVAGRLVFNNRINGITGYNKTIIQTPHFSSGVYFMRLMIGDKKFTQKIVYN